MPIRDRNQSSAFGIGCRTLTQRKVPLSTDLIQELNPTLRGWGEYYKRTHVRTLFHQLDGWIVRRIWSHRFHRWRCAGWKTLPARVLYEQLGLMNLVALIPSIAFRKNVSS